MPAYLDCNRTIGALGGYPLIDEATEKKKHTKKNFRAITTKILAKVKFLKKLLAHALNWSPRIDYFFYF